MKKTIGFLLVVGLMVAAMATVALAATPGDGIPAVSDDQAGTNFIDEDGDGVCDEIEDEDGYGDCDNANAHAYGEGALGEGNGYMGGRNGEVGEAGSHGNAYQGSEGGGKFLDEDGDGVCDHEGNGRQQQMGQGHGRTR